MNGLPTGSEILQNLNSVQGAELEEYLRKLGNLSKETDEDAYHCLFTLLNKSVDGAIRSPPEFKITPEIQEKMREIQEYVDKNLTEVVSMLQDTIEENEINDLSGVDEELAKREISNDGLCGFKEFEEGKAYKISFKLHKKILTHHDS